MKISKQQICFSFFTIIAVFLLHACSTTAHVNSNLHLKGKRIGIGDIKLSTGLNNSKNKVDTLCDCIVSTFSSSMNPFFQNAGFVVIDIPGSRKNMSPSEMKRLTDSLQLDYILVGQGLLDVVGKKHAAYFMNHLSIQIIDLKTREIIVTGDFSGTSVSIDGSIKRICKKLNKRLPNK
jgi:hypothetical protein